MSHLAVRLGIRSNLSCSPGRLRVPVHTSVVNSSQRLRSEFVPSERMSFVLSNEENIERIESSSDFAESFSASLCGGGSTLMKLCEETDMKMTYRSSSGELASSPLMFGGA